MEKCFLISLIATPKPAATQDEVVIEEYDSTPPNLEPLKPPPLPKPVEEPAKIEISKNGIRTRTIGPSEVQKFITKKVSTSPAMAVVLSSQSCKMRIRNCVLKISIFCWKSQKILNFPSWKFQRFLG